MGGTPLRHPDAVSAAADSQRGTGFIGDVPGLWALARAPADAGAARVARVMAVARLSLPAEHVCGVPAAQRRSWRTESRTPLLIAAVAYVMALVSGNRLLSDPDTFFHIAIGRWIWAHGFVPAVD